MQRNPDELKRLPTSHWEPSSDEDPTDTIVEGGDDDDDDNSY